MEEQCRITECVKEMHHVEHTEKSDSLDACPTYGLEDHSDKCNVTETQATLAHNSDANISARNQSKDWCEIAPPPADFQFNGFLGQIAKELTTEDVEEMKFYLSGTDGLTKREMEKIKEPLQLFTILKTRRLLTRDNLIYLQQLLRLLGNRHSNLIKRAVEFAKDKGNVLYFYQASEQPENGFKYIKFHVSGRNFKTYTRSNLQLVRDTVARILFVPAEFVLIAGVDPSLSLLITLMIPDLYVDIFKDFLELNDFPPDLHDLSIDIIEIHGKQYRTRGVADVETADTEQQQKLVNVYQHLQLKTSQLEDSEIERLRLEDDLRKAQERILDLEKGFAETSINLPMLEKMSTKRPALPDSQRALKEFKNKVQHSDVQTGETLIIHEKFDTNSEVVEFHMREERSLREQKQTAFEEIRPYIFPLLREADIDEKDKTLLRSLSELLKKSVVPILQLPEYKKEANLLEKLTVKGSERLKELEEKKLVQVKLISKVLNTNLRKQGNMSPEQQMQKPQKFQRQLLVDQINAASVYNRPEDKMKNYNYNRSLPE